MYKIALIVGLALVGTGCAAEKPNTAVNSIAEAQSNLATAKELYADFEKGDIKGVLSLMTDDIVWTVPGSSALPFSGSRHGKSEWMGYLKGLGAVDLMQFEPKQFLSDQDKVIVLGEERFKVKATGKVVDNDWVHVFTFKSGKVATFQSYDDTAAEEAGFR